MLKFKTKKNKKDKEKQLSQEDFLAILYKIKQLNLTDTPSKNNWKLRQVWINNYINLTIENLLQN